MKKLTKRRAFIKNSALGAGILGSLSSFNIVTNRTAGILGRPESHLRIAAYDYQRIKPLFDKKVEIKGFTFDMEKAGISVLNSNAFSGPQDFDVQEIGIVPFILAYANEDFRDYKLLPIFPLRMFRHKSIFVRANGSIKKPEDFKGKKVGTPGYSTSSLTWIRGMFKDEYGVSPMDIQWVIANKDSSADISGKGSKQETLIPDGIKITTGTAGKDESDLLVSEEVDALFHAVEPKAFTQGDPNIIRLFEDSRKVERAYYSKTGIFPIMHAVAVKSDLLEAKPRIAESVFDAFSEAKSMNYAFMRKLGWAFDMLPWYGQEHEDTRKLMGENFWPYGFDPNIKTLETVCRYCYEQGLIKKSIDYKELFHPASMQFSES